MKALSIESIAKLLQQYAGRYKWLDVFASQVRELHAPGHVATFERVAMNRYIVRGPAYVLGLEMKMGGRVARWNLAEPSAPAVGALVGGAIGALIADERRRVPEGLVVGLLVGAIAGAMAPPDTNRVMTMSFDPNSRRWGVYRGPYAQWAKEALRSGDAT
jgi:hypothetical protein